MQHNRNVKWLSEVKENGYVKQGEVNIDVERVKKQCGKIPNWKMPGLDGVQGYWFNTLRHAMKELLSSLVDYYMERRFPIGLLVATPFWFRRIWIREQL